MARLKRETKTIIRVECEAGVEDKEGAGGVSSRMGHVKAQKKKSLSRTKFRFVSHLVFFKFAFNSPNMN